MGISCIEASNIISSLNLQDSTKAKTAKSDNLNEISDNFFQSDKTQKFKEIVGKYDITSMSRNEMNDMTKDLYNNGLIDLKELGFLTFDYSKINELHGNSIKQATGIDISDNITCIRLENKYRSRSKSELSGRI